jgi:hypothetical protein
MDAWTSGRTLSFGVLHLGPRRIVSRLAFWRCTSRLSAGRPALLTEVSRFPVLPLTCQNNASVTPRPLPSSSPFQFIISHQSSYHLTLYLWFTYWRYRKIIRRNASERTALLQTGPRFILWHALSSQRREGKAVTTLGTSA